MIDVCLIRINTTNTGCNPDPFDDGSTNCANSQMESSHHYLDQSSPMKFNIGDFVYTKRIGGEWTKSEIILHRDDPSNEHEYFVHYEGFNRRLDEWVHEARIISIDDYLASNQSIVDYSDDDNLRKMTRKQKRRFDEMNHVQKSLADLDPVTAALERDYAERTKIKYITKLVLGMHEIDTWYYSPYPNEYEKLSVIFVCDVCLKYMALEHNYIRHLDECRTKTPPGRQIYTENEIFVFEVDGAQYKLYCQNLCLLAKLFLDHKTLYYDVSQFYFYVVYEYDGCRYHIASYFSKEKDSIDNFNVACILTLPPHQRKGYGKFLISLSYELTKHENITGTPERPLSDLGHASYRSYWAYAILDFLRNNKSPVITVNDISQATGFDKNDIVETLELLNLLKYWRGTYMSCFSSSKIEEYIKSGCLRPPRLFIDPQKLKL